MQSNDGLWYDLKIQPYRTTENKVEGVAITFSDITERKQAEEELRSYRERLEELVKERSGALHESAERFRVALQNSAVTVFGEDAGLRYTWVYNPSPGFSVDALLGKRDDDLYAPEDAAAFMAIKREVMATGIGRRDEVVTHRPASAGGDMVHDMTIEPLRDEHGKVVGITGAATDITARKAAEEALRRTAAQLKLAQETAKAGTWDWDMVTGALEWSDAYYVLYGIPRDMKPCY